LIARLDVKGPTLIKGIQFDGLRVLGNPQDFAQKYYQQGADEILYVDSVASLYNRNNLVEIVRCASSEIYVPLTVAGGIRSLEDARALLRCGADKVAINTKAIETPHLISTLAQEFGSQAVVVSIEAKKRSAANAWEPYTHGGREKTGLDAVEWALKAEQLGAGELLVTSVDKDGTRKGFDVDLVSAINSAVSIPVVASGGMGTHEHLSELVNKTGVRAVAMASCLHYNASDFAQMRQSLVQQGYKTRVAI
jgi:cyclase